VNWLKDIFKLKEKTCLDCEHYSEYKSEEKMNPDKSITKGKVLMRSCEKFDVALNDIKICDRFEYKWESPYMYKFRGSHAFGEYIKQDKLE
jgi:hypothetical protein